MKTLAALTLSLFLVSVPAFADSPKDADPDAPAPAKAGNSAKPRGPKVAKKGERSNAEFAAELDELRQAVQAQQEQLQLLREELAKRDRQIEEARESAAAANARAAEATNKAVEASTKAAEAANSSAEVKTTAASLNTTVSALKTSNDALATAAAKAQADAQKAEETGPVSIKYKGVTVAPGGFLEFAGVYRTRATSADINTPLTSIPYPGNSLAKVSEINFTGRHSRFTLLGEGNIGDVKATGYYEIDWLGACVTSNNRQSNSYCQRQRQIWGQAAWHGFSVTGGQMWTLATEDRKGINNRQEIQPLVVDPQYHVGYTWARQPAIRLVKEFGKVAVGISLENAQATLGGRGFTSYQNIAANGTVTATQNFFLNAPGAAGGLYNAFDATGYTPNKTPDIIVKAALDPGYGHYEVFGIVSTFRNRVYPCAVVSPAASATVTYTAGAQVTCAAAPPPTTTASADAERGAGAFTDSKVGGGVGASLRFPLFGKKAEFTAQGAAGDGIGRYGSAQIADETFRPDGTAALIRTAHGLGGLELHPTSKWDVYFYGGTEYDWRAAYAGYTTVRITNTPAVPGIAGTTSVAVTSTIGGYGHPAANNSGCSTETAPTGSFTPGTGGTCAGDIRAITQGTTGFWFKPYQGPKGGFRWGVQYSYLTKSGWSGAAGIAPKAVDNMVLTSFRYYIP